MREWRKTAVQSDEARKRSNARAYLHVYVKRGKVTKGPCEACGAEEVLAYHTDYEKPLAVIWLCKVHHGKKNSDREGQAHA
jgi:hypothetical protein